jgi:hypothetical protein
MPELIYPEDVDKRLNWPLGRAERLAKRGRLPHRILPDGSIRFSWPEVSQLIQRVPVRSTAVNDLLTEAERRGLHLTTGDRLESHKRDSGEAAQ